VQPDGREAYGVGRKRGHAGREARSNRSPEKLDNFEKPDPA
jgi:hypothetical protein